MSWMDNAAMFWEVKHVPGESHTFNGTVTTPADGEPSKWLKITDHNRSGINTDFERIERKHRMVDGTLRRYTVAKKRTWSTSWEMLPSSNTKAQGIQTADGHSAGEDIELFYYTYDDVFKMELRGGDGQIKVVNVMLSDFSKEISKRGFVDFWSLSVTLEEV